MFKIVTESFTGSSHSFQKISKAKRKNILIMGWIGFAALGFSPLTNLFSQLFDYNHLFAPAYFVVLSIYCYVMVVLSTQYDAYSDL